MAKTRKTSKAPADENKAQKFSRLASMRVSAALKKIKQIGNLSGSGYEYTPEQVAKIGEALATTMKQTMARFDKTGKSATAPEFTV